MNELVFLQNKQALTTSLKVAETFGKEHKNVIRDIDTLVKQMASVSQSPNLSVGVRTPTSEMFIKTTYQPEECGRRYPMYLMNFDGFTLLAMGFTGKKALQFKLEYIQAFNTMKQILLNRQNEEWRAIRQAGKQGNKSMCKVIHDVIIPLARAAGSTTADDKFYITYQKAVNRAAKIDPNSRDELPLGQLYEVEKLQNIVEVSVKGLAARGEGYKQIYKDTNQTLENYSRLSLIPERFLLA